MCKERERECVCVNEKKRKFKIPCEFLIKCIREIVSRIRGDDKDILPHLGEEDGEAGRGCGLPHPPFASNKDPFQLLLFQNVGESWGEWLEVCCCCHYSENARAHTEREEEEEEEEEEEVGNRERERERERKTERNQNVAAKRSEVRRRQLTL